MKIYVLKGHGERGKSTTLKKLIINIFDHFPKVKVLYSSRQCSRLELLNEIHIERVLRRKTNLNCDVENLQIVLDVGDKVVAINTAGDNVFEINKSIDLFDTYKCDKGFCACRSKGNTGKNLYSKYKTHIEFVPKAEIKNSTSYVNFHDWIDLLNDWQAEELLKKI